MIWDMIERMATERLWIYTAIAGSIFGALFIAWITDTRISLWVYGKWTALLNFLVERWGWTWFKQDPNAWTKLNPQLHTKIMDLEKRINLIEKKK